MLGGWLILMGYSQSRPQGTAVANPAGIPKFEHRLQVLDLVGVGSPPTGGSSQEYGGVGVKVNWVGALLKGESCPQSSY